MFSRPSHLVMRLLPLALVLFTAAVPAAPAGNRGECVKWVLGRARPLVPRVSRPWAAIAENLSDLGYPAHIIRKKIDEFRLREPAFEDVFRQVYEEAGLDPRRPLTGAELQKLIRHLELSYVMPFLPFWARVEGFDAPYVVHRLIGREEGEVDFDADDGADWLYFTPLWMRGKHGYANAKWVLQWEPALPLSFFIRRVDAEFAGAMARQRGVIARELNDAAMIDGEYAYETRTLLYLASSMPWPRLPRAVRESLARWVNLRRFPPLRLDGIDRCVRGHHFAGDCENMTYTHLENLGLYEHVNPQPGARQTVLIKVGGEIVGALKKSGDQSMIALRNVTSADGTLVLAMGGVYFLEKDVVERAMRLTVPPGGWVGLELPRLRVKPSTFLLNENAYSSYNVLPLLSLLADQMSKTELMRMLWDRPEDGDYPMDLQPRTWWALIDHLEAFRRAAADAPTAP